MYAFVDWSLLLSKLKSSLFVVLVVVVCIVMRCVALHSIFTPTISRNIFLLISELFLYYKYPQNFPLLNPLSSFFCIQTNCVVAQRCCFLKVVVST